MTRPSSQPMNRSELYRWVMALGFCAYDMLLYLDTHPDDAQALSYYNQCNELYNSAKKTYEERFEPLSAFGSQPLEDWDWNDGPRWGVCCPGKKQITFALQLYHMPPAAQIYVVVHEYCHFLQPNHSPAFWAEVAKLLPDWKARRALLK